MSSRAAKGWRHIGHSGLKELARIMQFQQKMWPHGVAVGNVHGERQSTHVGTCALRSEGEERSEEREKKTEKTR